MITPTQMRAARAMLDVSQGYVAEHLGIAANTLSKIESGQSDISASRMRDIERFYERSGVEFTDSDGVKWKSGGVETYQGRAGFLEFMDDVYETMKTGGEVLVNNVDESDFIKWIGDQAESHVKRMREIKNLNFRILVEEGDDNTVASSYASYRALPKEQFGTVPLYLYGDKTALIVFGEDDVEVFVVVHSAISQYFRSRFNH
ncbi:MAG: helix-turn-helix transcriptional regulator, partial [Alphaproteobacteria bacterium]|nr:helix-turn-helix transcriptional regulator [Alphaproteobacteria bacterium]